MHPNLIFKKSVGNKSKLPQCNYMYTDAECIETYWEQRLLSISTKDARELSTMIMNVNIYT